MKQSLASVKTFWKDLIEKFQTKLSVECPQLFEWHGRGPKPDDYYSLRNTFSYLWSHIESGRNLTNLKPIPDGKYFIVDDCARSLSKKTIERFIQVISDLTTNTAFRERMMTISTQKSIVETNLDKFHEDLMDIADDIKRNINDLSAIVPHVSLG